jgi:hypothetical protein
VDNVSNAKHDDNHIHISLEDNGLMEVKDSGSSINAQIIFMQNQDIVAKPNQ